MAALALRRTAWCRDLTRAYSGVTRVPPMSVQNQARLLYSSSPSSPAPKTKGATSNTPPRQPHRSFRTASPKSQAQVASETSKATATPPTPAAKTATTPAATKSTSKTTTPSTSTATKPQIQNLSSGLSDTLQPLEDASNLTPSSAENHVDWTRSFHGLSAQPFSKEAADILLQPLAPDDVEIKPDGIVYLPEIKYRRILNRAFGPGGWGLAPRGESIVTAKAVTREYALVAHGRLVSIARGEQDYFNPDNIPTATEGCKSNAMMRCCKDLGVASELWDPRFIRKFKAQYAREAFVEHAVSKKRSKIWLRKGDEVPYPWKEGGK